MNMSSPPVSEGTHINFKWKNNRFAGGLRQYCKCLNTINASFCTSSIERTERGGRDDWMHRLLGNHDKITTGSCHSVLLPIHFRCYIITRVSPHLSELFRLSWPPGPRFHSNQHRTSRRNGSPGSSCSLRDESGLVCRQPWLRVKDWQLAATTRKLEDSLLPNWWRAFKEWNDSLSTSGFLRQIR